jgi:hypothetical protein
MTTPPLALQGTAPVRAVDTQAIQGTAYPKTAVKVVDIS